MGGWFVHLPGARNIDDVQPYAIDFRANSMNFQKHTAIHVAFQVDSEVLAHPSSADTPGGVSSASVVVPANVRSRLLLGGPHHSVGVEAACVGNNDCATTLRGRMLRPGGPYSEREQPG